MSFWIYYTLSTHSTQIHFNEKHGNNEKNKYVQFNMT